MREKNVKMAESYVTDGSEKLSAKGVGSCVVVVVMDKEGMTAGIAHVALPSDESSNSKKYANNLLDELIEEMEGKGVESEDMRAKIAGGAELFDFSSSIGRKNIETVETYLEERNVSIAAEDVRGEEGRSVTYNPEKRELEVKKPFGERKLL